MFALGRANFGDAVSLVTDQGYSQAEAETELEIASS
jgi:hypothetical protein